MKNIRKDVKDVLTSIDCDIEFGVEMAFPDTVVNDKTNKITFFELSNMQTSQKTVDDIAFQIDIWCSSSLEQLFVLMFKVDEALNTYGLKRQFASSDSMILDTSGYKRKTLRYGRKIDNLMNRFID